MKEKFQRLRLETKSLKLSQSSATLGTSSLQEVAAITRCKCAWGKFCQLLPLLTNRHLPLLTRGKVYSSCGRSVMLHAAETWAMKVDTLNRLRRNDRAMICWICNVRAKDEVSSDSLLTKLGIQDLDVVLRTSRRRWTCWVQHRLDCRSTQAECGCTEKIWQAKEIMGWSAWEWQKEARYGFCWPSKSFWVERTPSRKTCQKAQPSVEENKALKWIWWWWYETFLWSLLHIKNVQVAMVILRAPVTLSRWGWLTDQRHFTVTVSRIFHWFDNLWTKLTFDDS